MSTDIVSKALSRKFYYSLGFIPYVFAFFLVAIQRENNHFFIQTPKYFVSIFGLIGLVFSMVNLGQGIRLAEDYQEIIKKHISKKVFDASSFRGTITAVCAVLISFSIEIPIWQRLILVAVNVALITFLSTKSQTGNFFNQRLVIIDWSILSETDNKQETIRVYVPNIKGIDAEEWIVDFAAGYAIAETQRKDKEKSKIDSFSQKVKAKIS